MKAHRGYLLASIGIALCCRALATTPDIAGNKLALNDMSDDSGIVAAIESGDLARLDQIIARPPSPLVKRFAEAGKARVNLDLDRSTQLADQCMADSKNARDVPQELACAMLSAGNQLLADHPGEWARRVSAIRQHFYPLLRQSQGNGFALKQLEQMTDYAKVARMQDKVSIAGNTGGSFALGVHRIKKDTFNPITSKDPMAVDIQAGDTHFDAIVDTAGTMLLLNAPTAAALGVTAVSPWLPAGQRASQLGMLPALKVGQVALANVPAAITDTAVPNVIGLTTLRRLGRLSFSSTRIVIGDELADHCTSQALAIRSDLIGTNPKVMLPLKVDGKAVLAVLDTGYGGALGQVGTDNPAELNGPVEERAIFTVGGARTERIVRHTRSIQLGKETKDVNVSLTPSSRGVSYFAGLQLLDQATVHIDFDKHTICVGR